ALLLRERRRRHIFAVRFGLLQHFRKFAACAAHEEVMPKRMPSVDQPNASSSTFSDRLQASRGSGQSLPDGTREEMESAIGADFTGVRVHDDTNAASMSDDIGARAFTHGRDIYFNQGQYETESDDGRRLLAHELTHTVQQGGSASENQPIQRGMWDDLSNWWGDVTDSRPDEARLDAQEELAVFMRNTFNAENHHPSTGRGLFDAVYRPSAGVLDINVKIHFNFQNGNILNPTWVSNNGGLWNVLTSFTSDQFIWTKDEKSAWKQNAIRDVRSAWQDQYLFHTTKPYWESLPSVHVHINILDADAANAHYNITVNKWPNDRGLRDGVVPPGASSNQSTGHFEETGENGIENIDDSRFVRTPATRAAYGVVNTSNPRRIQFDQGSDQISPADQARLVAFANTLGQSQIPPFPITLTGRASSEGDEVKNRELSSRRASAVSNILVANGAKEQPTVRAEGETGTTTDPLWRRVDISVGRFVSNQRTVLHEFGHIFGLGDEYPTPDGPTSSRPPGTPVAHSALAQALIPGQTPIVAVHNRNIMSNGEDIQPYHYVTFLEVLGNMTGMTGQWSIGPGPGGHAHEPGDFPQRRPGDPITV
ncbi:MAG: DUF4157 domain-containing protein, partial [Bacteroidota bacterium]